MTAVMCVKGSQNFVEKNQGVCYATPMRKIIFVCMVLGSSMAAQAHNLHQSSGTITVHGKTIQWDIIAHDLDVERFFHRLSVTPKNLRHTLSHRIVVENNGSACPLSTAHMDPSKEETDHYKIAMQFDCATPVARLALYYNLFFGERDHIHTTTAHLKGTPQTITFTGMKTSANITLP